MFKAFDYIESSHKSEILSPKITYSEWPFNISTIEQRQCSAFRLNKERKRDTKMCISYIYMFASTSSKNVVNQFNNT